MPIDLTREERDAAIQVLERWSREHLDEPMGNILAGTLLRCFLDEIAPAVYNQAIADAQQRLAERVQELDIELHAEVVRPQHQPAVRAAARRSGRG